MSKSFKIPLILYSAASRQIAAIRHVSPKDPMRGQITLPVLENIHQHVLRDLKRRHLSGDLSDFSLYSEMESLLPRSQAQIEVSPSTKFRVLWFHNGPAFLAFREPHIIPGMMLQNSMNMVDIHGLCFQDKLIARTNLSFFI